MARTRDLVALSAIFVAPLAAILISQAVATKVEPALEVTSPAPAEVVVEVVAPEVVTPEVVAPAAQDVPPALEEVTPTPEPAPVSAPVARDPGQAMLLHRDALLVHSSADGVWGAGRTTIKADPGHLVASKPALWYRLPPPARDLAGATVVVYAADGSACVTTVGAARLQLERTGEIYPHDTEGDEWGTWEPPASKAVLKDMVEKLIDNDGPLLLAEQRGQGGRPCQGLWARRADLPAPAVFGRRELVGDEAAALAAEALKVVRTQPEFVALAGDYAAWLADLGPEFAADEATWEAFVAANFRATRWDEVGGPRQFVSVELTPLDREPCSHDFADGFALLLELRADGLVRLDQSGWFDLAALMDVDRDGVLEGVSRTHADEATLQAAGPDAAALRDGYSIEFVGCPC